MWVENLFVCMTDHVMSEKSIITFSMFPIFIKIPNYFVFSFLKNRLRN